MSVDPNFDYCVAIILQDEGGLVTNPNDPGGTTNFGISQRAFPSLNIPTLTEAQAEQIYYDKYWMPNQCGEVPAHLDLWYFTACVMSGGATATKLLQQLIGVLDDGVMGPLTIKAVQQFPVSRHYQYLTLFTEHLMSLGDWHSFNRGWLNRLYRLAGL